MMIYLRLIKESFLIAWQAIVINKLRTILSLLGVTVGIFCIITVFTLVDTMEHGLKDSFSMLEDDVLFVQKWPWAPEDGDEEYAWWKYFQRTQPSIKNMYDLEKRLEYSQAMAFQTADMKTAKYMSNFIENSVMVGVSYEYDRVIKLEMEKGRYFTSLECTSGRPVAIIGHDIAENLFAGIEPVGKSMKVGGLKVDVIGVFEKEGNSILGNGFDEVIMVPYSFSSRLIDVRKVDNQIMVKAKDGVSNQQLKDEIISNFRAIRNIRPKEDEDFSVNEMSMITAFIDGLFGLVNAVGFFIGIFAIIVGGFSIANIMFVSVKERTNIIGIQKALGAKNYFILTQFLFESVALCVFGGIAGLILIALGVALVNALTDTLTVGLYASNVIIGILFSVVIGLLSGIIPAWFASRLNPVDAMRAK